MIASHAPRTASLLLALACAAPSLGAQAPGPADTLFLHGDILTGTHLQPNDADPVPARVHALAVRDGRILAAGTDDQILALKGPQTTIVDLAGHFVMPGFNDAHTHMASAGRQRLTVDLDNVPSLAALQDKVRAYAATLAPGQWITGAGWDHTKWPSQDPNKPLPSRQDLDPVSAGHPAVLERTDGHIAVLNTAALDALHITSATPSPQGGQIDHDPSGQPTGIVRDTALDLVRPNIPPPSYEQRKRALHLAIDDALAHGVTSVQDFSDWNDWLVLEELERAQKLPLRVFEWIDVNLPLPALESRRRSHDPDDPLLHLGMLKGFMDGSLGSRTAALSAPYADDPTNSGIPRYDPDQLSALATERAAAGFQLGFHAIGDHANDLALDAFTAAEQAGVPAPVALCRQHEERSARQLPPDAIVEKAEVPCDAPPFSPGRFRFRIEHAQVVSPGAFDRFAALGVIASMQPSHLLTDMAWAPARLGPERSKYAYAWHSFLTHGVTLAFGTDFPVESINPFRGLYAAVTRQNEAGTQTFEPQERLTLNQALFAYTQGSAFAEWREYLKGRLSPGFLADLIVLDRDITHSTPQQLLHTQVLRTVVGGETRFSIDGPASSSTAPSPVTPPPVASPPASPQPPTPAPPGSPASPHNPSAPEPPAAPDQPTPPQAPEAPRTGVSHPPGETPQ